jgi:hypothetical protein
MQEFQQEHQIQVKQLLDGQIFRLAVIHYGARADQTITVSISNVKASNIGILKKTWRFKPWH